MHRRQRTLEIMELGHEDQPPEALNIFSIAPRLRKVFLTTPSCDDYSPLVPVPMEHLTHYRAVGTAGWFLEVLREATNLVETAHSLPGPDVAALLQNTPRLQDLVLHDESFGAENNHLLSVLTVSGSPEDIFPNLDFLGYGGWTSLS
ncbi:hypothetical protein C8R47DRAFT_1208862 [Mycena vitilis]|nr:hypothetical protein C8R47DRAFT_1208862 [Mycena vitilis]